MKTNPTALMRRAGAGVSTGALVTASLLLVASPAHAANHVVTSNLVDQSETRTTGHNVFGDDGVRVYTEGHTSTDKAAGYFDAHVSLADAGEPSMSWSPNGSVAPGDVKPSVQLKTDFDGDGSIDGILVGEPTYADGSNLYGDNWWLSNGSKAFVKDGAPSHVGGTGSTNNGTLDQWRGAFPNAKIVQSGWSLGSGVKGDGTINSITVGADRYYFAKSADRQAVKLYANDVDTSSTRSTGHNEFRPTSGVNVYTEGNGSTDKAAGFVDINQPLVGLGEPSMDFRRISGSIPPGLWLNLDIDGDGAVDGSIISEPAYGNDWWLNDPEGPLAEYAPTVGGGSGSDHHGALAEWRATLPAGTEVVSAGWSLGSGVEGSYIVDHITVGQKVFSFGNRAPVANDVTGSVRDDGTTTIQTDASDPDGDALTYSVNGADGDASVNSNGVISYDPDGTTGSDSFTYKVTDAAGATATANVTVTINANGVPVANDVTGTAHGYGQAEIPTDASDPDGDSLSYIIGSGEEDGSIGAPTKGVASVGTDGIISYTPDSPTDPGTDSFTYTVTDGHGGSATANVTVTIGANTAPVAPTVNAAIKSGGRITLTLPGTDADGDSLLYTIPETVDHGTADLGNGDNNDEVTFTADSNFLGHTSFTYHASDGLGGTTTGTVKISVARAGSKVSLTTTPVSPTSHQKVTVHVVVGSTGYKYRGKANIFDGTKLIGSGQVHTSGLQDIVLKHHLSKGTHTIRVKYYGTKYTAPKQHSIRVTVR